ncbi:PASTA domain-containing protein, partial [Nocardioides albidus]|uniref:PASTA domain-containing protein n=1 Tax=Nocardioides albidus TaxID=1517589 RepID=UPI0019602331
PAVPPSKHEDDLTPEIDAIVMKALAKRVEDRYQSAAQMRADIERYLAGRPVQAVLPAATAHTSETSVVTPRHAAVVERDDHAGTAIRPPLPPDRDSDRRSRATLWVLLGILVAAIIGTAFFVLPRLFDTTPPPERVPNVVRMTEDDARAAIGKAGFEVGTVSVRNDDKIEAGRVIEQNPVGDDYVEADSRINLVVSIGPGQFALPSVIEQKKRDAIAALVAAGISERNVSERECDTDEPKGTVVEQNPLGSTMVDRDATVELCVSDGPEKVPNVIGLKQADAEQAIRDAGFVPVVRDGRPDDATQKKGRITEQIPGDGRRPKGTEIIIFVSIYEPAPPPPADTDADGLPDGEEAARGTNPANPDSDGDGVSDGAEVTAGTDPLNPLGRVRP